MKFSSKLKVLIVNNHNKLDCFGETLLLDSRYLMVNLLYCWPLGTYLNLFCSSRPMCDASWRSKIDLLVTTHQHFRARSAGDQTGAGWCHTRAACPGCSPALPLLSLTLMKDESQSQDTEVSSILLSSSGSSLNFQLTPGYMLDPQTHHHHSFFLAVTG